MNSDSTGSARRLRSSFIPRRKIFASDRRMSGFLLAQRQLRDGQEADGETGEREVVGPQLGEAEALREGADADLLEPGGRERQSEPIAAAGQRRYRREHAGEVHRRYDRDDGGAEDGGDLGPREGRHDEPEAGGGEHVEERADGK